MIERESTDLGTVSRQANRDPILPPALMSVKGRLRIVPAACAVQKGGLPVMGIDEALLGAGVGSAAGLPCSP
jgi:hypothetical protein